MIEILADATDEIEAVLWKAMAIILTATVLAWTFYVVHYYGVGVWATVVAFFGLVGVPTSILTNKAYDLYDKSRSY